MMTNEWLVLQKTDPVYKMGYPFITNNKKKKYNNEYMIHTHNANTSV